MLQMNTSGGRGAGGKAGYYGVGLAAAAAAASAAFFLDPRSGARRRALVRDQVSRAAHQSREFAGKAGRDARQRARGMYEGSVANFRRGEIDDRILEERVRAALGRLTPRPGPIEVRCERGAVRLRGDILEADVDTVLRGVARVHGVREVVNDMRTHREPGNIPALQGAGVRRSPKRFEYLQSNWSPAPRAIAIASGVAMIVSGVARRSPLGYALAATGAGLLARSICNMPLSHLAGIRRSEADGVLVQKTIEVYAEPDEVYESWRNLEDLPRFMSHVREVRRIDDRRYHWVVDGPAGLPVGWDAEVTADVPNELIAWRTADGSSVHSSGVVQFEPTSYGGTRVHIRMSYRPPANALGHTVAKVFGRDPKRQIDTDLMRFKTYMEIGSVRSDRHGVRWSDQRTEPRAAAPY